MEMRCRISVIHNYKETVNIKKHLGGHGIEQHNSKAMSMGILNSGHVFEETGLLKMFVGFLR